MNEGHHLSGDEVLDAIADYVAADSQFSTEAYETARMCILDSLGCALLALNYPACTKLLGPVVPGAEMAGGARVPGTRYCLDPVHAAFNLGTMIRWLDFNDTWLAREWGHPSDNLGSILTTADYINGNKKLPTVTLNDLCHAMIQTYEIQGILALENAMNRVGLDHVLYVRVASTAVITKLLGGNRDQIRAATSQSWLDGGALRTYRHAPNTGSRKSWAAGDATSRAVQLALWTLVGEPGYETPLSTPGWGFCDSLFRGEAITVNRPFSDYVMKNILFKVSYPAEFHAQTAVEAAVSLHKEIKGSLAAINKVAVGTHEAAMRIIDKKGPLKNPADRDHCLQYMIAVPLLTGDLRAQDYEDETARDPRIDQIRDKIIVHEVPQFSVDYLDPEKRAIPNSLTVHLSDRTVVGPVQVDFPLGHRRRREEARPLLLEKFRRNASTRLDASRIDSLENLLIMDTGNGSLDARKLVDLTIP